MKRRWLLAVCVVGLVTGCALPQHKDFGDLSKKSVTWSEATNVVAAFNSAVDAASSSYNLARLSDVEGGSSYDIDAAALFAQERLGLRVGATRLDGSPTVLTSDFRRYPLWFVAVGDAYSAGQRIVGVFAKTSSTDRWHLELAPRIASSTSLPRLATTANGATVPVDSTQKSRWRVAPQTLIDHYAQVLADPRSGFAGDFANDAFLASTRAAQQAQPDRRVAFTETWSAERVSYALRLADGGALVFATVVRRDTYRVLSKNTLSWQGSPAAAYFEHPVKARATLTYDHQLLVWQPVHGQAVVIGQYGGLVSATGH